MTPHENFIIGALSAAWSDLLVQDQQRGGDGLRDMAITLTQGRTTITVCSDFRSGDRTLTSSFRLSPPLPPTMCALLREFLMDLYEGLPAAEPWATLH